MSIRGHLVGVVPPWKSQGLNSDLYAWKERPLLGTIFPPACVFSFTFWLIIQVPDFSFCSVCLYTHTLPLFPSVLFCATYKGFNYALLWIYLSFVSFLLFILSIILITVSVCITFFHSFFLFFLSLLLFSCLGFPNLCDDSYFPICVKILF